MKKLFLILLCGSLGGVLNISLGNPSIFWGVVPGTIFAVGLYMLGVAAFEDYDD